MSRPLRIGLLAGETSGDLLGAGLIRAIRARHPDTLFEGIGGPAMLAEGFHTHFPMDRLSVMGFVEPLGRLPELLRIDRTLRQHFLDHPPDVFVGIDSPGFNLRFEERLRQRGIPTVHYVSPSVWAYGEKRILRIRRAVDLMLVLFPFESMIYEVNDVPVRYVGHPLADRIEGAPDRQAARQRLGLSPAAPVVAVLPGSRHTEVNRLTPVMIEAMVACRRQRTELQVVLPCAASGLRSYLEAQLQAHQADWITLVDGQAHAAMAAADSVVLASGTATLEALLLRRPMVICYRLSSLTYLVAARLVKVPYVGLPNLLAGRRLVPELLQDDFTVENVVNAVERSLAGADEAAVLSAEYDRIHATLRCGADDQAAQAILGLCGR